MEKRCLGCMETYSAEYMVCPNCGYLDGTGVEEPIHMAPGSLLHDRYIIGKVLGYGGFGVTYIAWDGKLRQKVAIKEYLPGEFSTRMPGQTHLTVFNGEKSEQYYDGLKRFVEEARHLAKFQNEEGIVKIFDSFEENMTAYIVMEYLDGMTLTEYLKEHGTIPEDEAVKMLMPVMESLTVVHEEGLLHRDIAPDNVFLTKSGEVKLIDFGASRYATTSHSRSLTVIIKPGFSPEEQYRSRGDQGPYTDVYALAATLYKMITGKTPPDAMERRSKYEQQNKDILTAPHKINKKISINRENAILNAMNVRIEDRTQDVRAFINELESDVPAKRRYGKIKKIDVYSWPLWMKIVIPVIAVSIITGGIWLAVVGIGAIFGEGKTVLEGYAVVPDVVGLDEADARDKIEDANLQPVLGRSEHSPYIELEKIFWQDPPAGSERPIKTRITYSLSRESLINIQAESDGTRTVNFRGQSVDELKNIEKEWGIKVNYNYVYSEDVAENVIITDKEFTFKSGDTIDVEVSKGPKPVPMPDVTGMTEDEARATLAEIGLAVQVEYRNDNSIEEGTVITQNPLPEASVRKDKNTVTVYVSSGKEIITVPAVTGMTKDQAEATLSNAGFKVSVVEEHSTSVANGKVISVAPGEGSQLIHGSDIMLVVSLGKKPVTVSYDANGGSVSPSSHTKYYGDSYGTLPTPTREGYTFSGWYSTSSSVQITSQTPVSFDRDHTLTAKWTAGQYTVNFVTNCDQQVAPMAVDYNGTYSGLVSLSNSAKPGYTFTGWYTAQNGGTRVTASSTVKTAGNHSLYARWEAKTLSVTFDANGGSAVNNSISVSYGSTYGTLPTTTRTGYTFKGWYTASSGGTKVTGSSTVTNSQSHKLYAQWTVNQYTLSFDANGGSVSESSRKVNYGAGYGTLPNPTRKYYTFDGWYTAKTGGTKVSSSTTMSAQNVTVYARWTPEEYKVTWSDGTGYSVSVERTSSPNAGAYIGNVSNGASVYYGDVLKVTYTASSGYTLDSKGATSITVTGNVTSAQIYAQASTNSYTYNIKYVSTNGTNLGSSTATYAYGTTNTITPPSKSGYTTPSAQSVVWDSSTPKTITFKYAPSTIDATKKSGYIYKNYSNTRLSYDATIEHRNRTANSVQIRVTWKATLSGLNGYHAYNSYAQNFRASVGSVSTGNVNICPYGTWSSSALSRSATKSSAWITVPLSTTNKTNIDMSVYYYQANSNGTDMSYDGAGNMSATWSVAIPAY